MTELSRTHAVPAAVTQTTAVEQARAVAEVAAAVRVAQDVPRDTRRAFAEMHEACARIGLAERAFYSVPRRGSGPSVHLARELARIWGNLDYGVHELSRDDDRGMSEVRAYAWDQQTNVRSSRTFQVPHRRMGGGAALTDLTEIYLNNQNVGARAVRETIYAILPRDFVDEAIEKCRATIKSGGGVPILERIERMIAVFAEMGVKVPQLERRIGRKRGQWTPVDVADLTVVWRSLRSGDTTVADEFPDDLTPESLPPTTTGPRTHPQEPMPEGQRYPAAGTAEAEVREVDCPGCGDYAHTTPVRHPYVENPERPVDPDDWPEPATPGGDK